jgi:hypothetical protein
MELPPKLFRRLVGQAPLPMPRAAGERRDAARVFVGRHATVYDAEAVEAAREPVVVRDLSPRSAGLLLGRPLVPGGRLILSVPAAEGVAVVVLEVRVVRCAAGSDAGGARSFVVAVAFVNLLVAPTIDG